MRSQVSQGAERRHRSNEFFLKGPDMGPGALSNNTPTSVLQQSQKTVYLEN